MQLSAAITRLIMNSDVTSCTLITMHENARRSYLVACLILERSGAASGFNSRGPDIVCEKETNGIQLIANVFFVICALA